VVVRTPQQGITSLLLASIGQGATSTMPSGTISSLKAPLLAAQDALDRGNTIAATEQLGAFKLYVAGLVRGRQLDAATGTEWTAQADRILASINR
jgi:hypothetical protein